MRLPRLVFACLLLSAAGLASDTPEQAILETIFATDGKTVLKHLPPDFAEAIDSLPERARAAARERLLPKSWFGAKAVKAEDGVNLLRVENPHARSEEDKRPVFIRITRQVSDGAQAVVQLETCQEKCYGSLQVWMRLQEGEWRFVDIREGGRSVAQLDDPEFLSRLRDEARGGGERQAVAYMRTLNTALITYLSTYSIFPREMRQLSGTDVNNPTADRAMLLEPEFLAIPCIIGGYRYQYQVQGSGGEYEITARPVEYGEGNRRSFYSDQSGIIRSTSDDRPATRDDKPI